MKNHKTLQNSSVALIGLIMLGSLTEISPALANEFPIISSEEVERQDTPIGNSQDLTGLEEKNTQQWQWGVNEESVPNRNNLEYKIDTDNARETPSVDLNRDDEDWENLNRGEPRNRGGEFPLTQF